METKSKHFQMPMNYKDRTAAKPQTKQQEQTLHSKGVQQIHVLDDEEPGLIPMTEVMKEQQSGFQRPPSLKEGFKSPVNGASFKQPAHLPRSNQTSDH